VTFVGVYLGGVIACLVVIAIFNRGRFNKTTAAQSLCYAVVMWWLVAPVLAYEMAFLDRKNRAG
jgi:hypothetical protein